MKAISIWSSQNQKTAILLIIVFEVLKCGIGFDIGLSFLPAFATGIIEFSVLGLVFLTTFFQTSYQNRARAHSKEAHRRFRLISTSVIMYSSLFLSILLGNHIKGLGYSVQSVFAANAAETVTTTTTDNTRTGTDNGVTEKKAKKGLVARLLGKKTTDDPKSNYRITYVLLFLLSLVLAFGGVLLTCNLACGGFALLAVLAFLLSLGVLSGGIYFLIKAFKKDIKPFQSMTREEKKKERRTFFTIWALIAAITGLVALLS